MNDREIGSLSGDAASGSRAFPVVALGASAGGVRALREFFDNLPFEVGAAFVVVVHLDPAYPSELSRVLAAHTPMPVHEAVGAATVEPNHVYVISPNLRLRICGVTLKAEEFREPKARLTPIDFFFRSLADRPSDDFAIVLSGAGSDGALGARAIKEAGGTILVQDPEEAEYASMPRSAIAAGVADFVLPVREIAKRLPELVDERRSLADEDLAKTDDHDRQRILSHLRVRTGHDFAKYKGTTVRRRIARRMQVRRAATQGEYLRVLRENPDETQALFSDLLISVTTFFRDPAAFETLEQAVVPRLFFDKSPGDAIRAWIAGCATGEEAYSIAMLLAEEAERRETPCEIQIFASDLDSAALLVAREGCYPLTIEADVSKERLSRFFTREIDCYRVKPELREMVLFARHSLLKDPPFSKLDLISCRNLLIYLDRELQRQVCGVFHFALRPGGYLFLGSCESVEGPAGMFRVVDREARIYESQRPVESSKNIAPTLSALGSRAFEPAPARRTPASRQRAEASMHREALERAAPPSVLVDDSYRVIHLSETAGRYLQPSAGPLSNDLSELVREDLRSDLRAALHRAFSNGGNALGGPTAMTFEDGRRRVYIHVKPLVFDSRKIQTAIVFFFEGETPGDSPERGAVEAQEPDRRVGELTQELQFIRSQLLSSREEYETANEELRSANEELQSINEEYRSTSEELETSKEELQSINEELQTVNSELKTKLESVSRAHSDIQNLMVATDVGILFLDRRLRIKRFTPRVTDLFNIVSGDEGRSITDFTHNLDYEGLERDAQAVLRDLSSIERQVRSRDGSWRLMRMRPYRTVENKIDGVVVTLVDFTERRRAEEALRESEARLRSVIDGVGDAIVTIDASGAMRSVNSATVRVFGYSQEEMLGKDAAALIPPPFGSRRKSFVQNYAEAGAAEMFGSPREVEGRRKDGSYFPAELMVSQVRRDEELLFIVFVRDLSEKRKFEARLDRLHKNRLSSMAEMVTALAHEINQPLAAAATYLQAARRQFVVLEEKPFDIDKTLNSAAGELVRAGRIIGQLRQFISHGEPEKSMQNLHQLIRQAYELSLSRVQKAGVEFVLRLDAGEDAVLADKLQIQQVLLNLIRNAREAMIHSNERVLTISTQLRNGDIQTDVIDTGCGLTEAARAELFEPFNSTKSDGLGVGLAISQSIIEGHYGKLWAEPNTPSGSRFSFTLPLAGAISLEE
ncbi:CheR family methyltransferase [Methylocystis heyeri]|uniref:PAS domain S-box protein n=1 Tax=Methylocystis heyeri TaxID=391905 RepID=A0A6B8KJG0_9HYPH|nr:CheR family methyltransferase [Methylocystis heyeri]QGM47065.1 PAS domain S-box protein [Methylocystis heyeri]